MPADVRGFEEPRDETPWCVQCAQCLKWPYHDECLGCLNAGGRPAETVTVRTVHWDTAVLHAIIRRKVATWEQRHPGWELVPDFARYWEDMTHPSKYVDRETGVGRKLAWTRFRVERRHPRGAQRWLATGVAEQGEWLTEALWAMLDNGAAMPPGWPLRRWVPQEHSSRWGPQEHIYRDPYREGVRVMAEPKEQERTQADANPNAPAVPGPTVPGEEPDEVQEGTGEQQARAARQRQYDQQAVPKQEEAPMPKPGTPQEREAQHE